MKRLTTFFLTALFATAVAYPQTLDEIMKQYSAAMGAEKLASIKTIKITGRMSSMGLEMPMVMQMKNPNKIKMSYSFSGQQMVSVFDGTKGYMVNPMTGSTQPVELTGEQLKQVQANNPFNNNELINHHKTKRVTLEGTEDVNGSPTNKLKITPETGQPIYMFIDKKTGLITKTTTVVSQMGTTMNVESFMTDYINVNGVVVPKKTSIRSGGMEVAAIYFDDIEVDIPIDDSVFKIN